MFEATLKTLVEQVDAARGAAVLSVEGLVIDAVDGTGAVLDAEKARGEYASVFEQLVSVDEAVGLGDVQRLDIEGEAQTVIVRSLSPKYVATLTVGNEAIPGKAWFQLRCAAPDLAREL